MRRPSPALIVATLALIVATSGTSYAVSTLPRNSVGAAQIKKNAVTSAKIRNGAIQPADLATQTRTALKGETGARGEKGDAGAPGSARAYAIVQADGTVVAARSKNIPSASQPSTGQYCIAVDPSIDPRTVAPVVTVNWGFSTTNPANGLQAIAEVWATDGTANCPSGIRVYTYERALNGTITERNQGFVIAIP